MVVVLVVKQYSTASSVDSSGHFTAYSFALILLTLLLLLLLFFFNFCPLFYSFVCRLKQKKPQIVLWFTYFCSNSNLPRPSDMCECRCVWKRGCEDEEFRHFSSVICNQVSSCLRITQVVSGVVQEVRNA